MGESILSSLRISGTGLSAQRTRMNVISQNIANAETTRTDTGGPYQRKQVAFSEKLNNIRQSNTNKKSNVNLKISNPKHIEKGKSLSSSETTLNGVEVDGIERDEQTPFKTVYNPSHPDADEDGYVTMPNINIVQEMVDMISASRAYQANVTTMKNSKDMFNSALDISRA